MSSRCRDALRTLLALLLLAASAAAAAGEPAVLRVCAHPDNLPFSAQDESGFDNRIAKLVGQALHRQVEYVWFEPQHGLLRKTLGAGLCDALFGLPQGYEGAALTRPYYRSRYVLVLPHDAQPHPMSLTDPSLLRGRIGVQVIGDDMAATPPGHALARAGARHVVGFPVYGERPAVARMVDAVARGELDGAIGWGPAAGYFAALAPRQLDVLDLAPADAALPFEFAIAVAVRRDDSRLLQAIDEALAAHRAEIEAVLAAYHVPRADPLFRTSFLPCIDAASC